jgi:hypothetical protein
MHHECRASRLLWTFCVAKQDICGNIADATPPTAADITIDLVSHTGEEEAAPVILQELHAKFEVMFKCQHPDLFLSTKACGLCFAVGITNVS